MVEGEFRLVFHVALSKSEQGWGRAARANE